MSDTELKTDVDQVSTQSAGIKALTLPNYFYSIDLLRGLAALGVVLFHWPYLAYPAGDFPHPLTQHLPLAWLFKPIYYDGWRFVDLFFCISGFIFYWLYGSKVKLGQIHARKFAVLRFSRLYPLHLVTLILVALGQYVHISRHMAPYMHKNNTVFNFVLHLFFASQWQSKHNGSFNGPVWSVSVEILLYFTFYVLCRSGLTRWWYLVLMVVAGELLRPHAPSVARGFVSFYLGGLSFYVVEGLARFPFRKRILVLPIIVTVASWVWLHRIVQEKMLVSTYDSLLPHGGLEILGKHPISLLIRAANPYLFEYFLFPLTIITLALVECKRGTLGKRFRYFGHCTYSSYMLHFPLQLGLVLIGSSFAAGSSFYWSPLALVFFFGILIPLSLASYFFFEKPAQSYLRGLLERPPR